jgi:hypothetical protein
MLRSRSAPGCRRIEQDRRRDIARIRFEIRPEAGCDVRRIERRRCRVARNDSAVMMQHIFAVFVFVDLLDHDEQPIELELVAVRESVA